MKQWLINCVLFIICLTALGFSLIKITPLQTGEGAYVGIITSLLSLAVTLLIGYQIYNSVELRKDIIEQRHLLELSKNENEDFKKRLIEQQYQAQEGFDIISALVTYNSNDKVKSSINAFAHMHHALLSSIETDRDDYEWIFMYMREFLSKFSGLAFCGSWALIDGKWIVANSTFTKNRTIDDLIKDYLIAIRNDEMLLRGNKNFVKIKMEYNRIMRILSQVMDKIKENPNNALSSDFVNDIISPQT